MKIELTQDEASMICYALKEIASRRYEQAIDRNQDFIRREAELHTALSNRILNDITNPK